MTLEQAYKKVHMMDEILNSDILNDEEYTSVAKRRFKLMEQIGLEEQRQKQLKADRVSPEPWDCGFLFSFIAADCEVQQLSKEQRNIIYAIKRVPFRYAGRYFEVVDDKLIVKMVPEKSFLEI